MGAMKSQLVAGNAEMEDVEKAKRELNIDEKIAWDLQKRFEAENEARRVSERQASEREARRLEQQEETRRVDQLAAAQRERARCERGKREKEKQARRCACCVKPGNPKLKKCSVCKRVWYCNTECRDAHWETHKPDCKPPSR
jgi:hypothetical protein